MKSDDHSRLRNNFQRLMQQCKKLSQDIKQTELWRFEAYVQHLEKLFLKLQDGNTEHDRLMQYGSELYFLKGILEAEKKSDAEARLLAAKQLPVSSDSVCEETPRVSLRQVRAKATSQYTSDLRKELLGHDGGSGLRQAGDALDTDNADIDAVLKHHHDLQTKMAEDFLQLTRSLKQTASAAGQVVQRDNKTLERVDQSASRNYSRLASTSQRLEQQAYRSWWDCGLWTSLLLVCVTFIAMVLFMRLFPKH